MMHLITLALGTLLGVAINALIGNVMPTAGQGPIPRPRKEKKLQKTGQNARKDAK